MKNTGKLIYGLGLVALGACVLMTPVEEGAGLLGFIFLPVILAYSGIIAYLVKKDNKDSETLLDKISRNDPAWEIDHLQARIDEVFSGSDKPGRTGTRNRPKTAWVNGCMPSTNSGPITC